MTREKARRAVAAFAAVGVAFAAAGADDFISIDTETTTLALRVRAGAWNIEHYGAKASLPDVDALARASENGTEGNVRNASYTAFGDSAPGYSMTRYGGLQVVHADGCVTTELAADGVERVAEGKGTGHVVLRHKDRFYPIRVDQHFRWYDGCDVIETWVEIENGEGGDVRLGRMDSFAVVLPPVGPSVRLQSASARWGAEGQIRESAVERGQSVAIGSHLGTRSAWEDNAAFMVSFGDGPATETAGRVFGGALCWSGAWDASVRHDAWDCVEIRSGASTLAGAYVLGAGKRLTLPTFAFTWSEDGKGRVSRAFHRWAREHRLPDGNRLRPILLNSWEGSYFTYTEQTLVDMMDGVAEMGGEMFVLDDGWFGTGKFARDDDGRDRGSGRQGLGDWVVNPKKHPLGLKWLAEEAEGRDLKFGIWVEPEMVNTNSHLYTAHPDWIVREPHRPVRVGRGGSQTVLDFANPEVRSNILGQLDALYASIPGLAYVKWDANADFYNVGSPSLPADRQSNLPFDYTTGLYGLLAELRARHPGIDLQACSSGGARMDYGFLKYADEFWTSDDTDARERVFIQWGASQFFPACAMASHVTASPNHQTHRETPLKFRFDVAMSGRFGFELHPKDMKPEEIAFAKRCVADYKRIRPTVQQGDLYRLASPYEGPYAALMYVGENADKAVVFAYGLSQGLLKDFTYPLRLRGLDPAKRYEVKEITRLDGKSAHTRSDGRVAAGAALMSIGIPARLKGDYDSAVFELTAVR